ncbi:MAG: hypothetical protein EOO43_13565, partial [Flavobacterium sp.]
FFNAFNRVLYPLLSTAIDDVKLRRVYSQLIRIIVFIVTPFLLFLAIIAEPFFRSLLTEKWLPAVPYFQLLILSGIFYPIQNYNQNICNIKGRSDIVLKLSSMNNLLLIIGAASCIWYGIYGLLISLVVVNFLTALVTSYFSGRLINYKLANQMSDIVPILVLNFAIGLSLLIVHNLLISRYPDNYQILIIAIIHVISYFGIAILFRMTVVRDLVELMKKR